MSVPGTRKAWAEMPTGRRRWVTAPLERHLQRPNRDPRFPATTPEVSGPPRTPILPLCPHPLPVPAGSSVCPLDLSGGLR